MPISLLNTNYYLISTTQTVILDGPSLRNSKIELHTEDQFIPVCQGYVQIILPHRHEWMIKHCCIGWHFVDRERTDIRAG